MEKTGNLRRKYKLFTNYVLKAKKKKQNITMLPFLKKKNK